MNFKFYPQLLSLSKISASIPIIVPNTASKKLTTSCDDHMARLYEYTDTMTTMILIISMSYPFCYKVRSDSAFVLQDLRSMSLLTFTSSTMTYCHLRRNVQKNQNLQLQETTTAICSSTEVYSYTTQYIKTSINKWLHLRPRYFLSRSIKSSYPSTKKWVQNTPTWSHFSVRTRHIDMRGSPVSSQTSEVVLKTATRHNLTFLLIIGDAPGL